MSDTSLMSDTAYMGRTGRSDFARGGAALIVMAAGIVVAATHDATPVAKASTVLVQFKDADVVSASGDTHAATAGRQIAANEVITTGPHGFAQLLTRGRLVLLGSNAALAVLSGDHQQLRTGTAVVNALTGPGLDLDVSADTVRIPDGSATEASRGASVRIGSLSGPANVTSSNGRQLALPHLSQVVINGDALPANNSPLHLLDSDDEARVVPRLVADDLSLKSLARGIDTTGRSTAHVIEASWTGVSQPIPDHSVRSERVLPVLIAKATRGGDVQQRYDNAVAWRTQGGSWGVVLHLLNGRAAQVESTLASLQKATQTPGQVGEIVPTAIGAVTGSTPTGSSTPSVGGGTTYPVGTHSPGTSHPTPSGASPSSSASPNLLGSLVSTLQSVIDGVLGLLPHDATAATPHTTKKSTSDLATSLPGSKSTSSATTSESTATPATTKPASPQPTATSKDGVLGNLLGGLLKPINHTPQR